MTVRLVLKFVLKAPLDYQDSGVKSRDWSREVGHGAFDEPQASSLVSPAFQFFGRSQEEVAGLGLSLSALQKLGSTENIGRTDLEDDSFNCPLWVAM